MSESARRAVREHLVAARAEQVAMLAELVRQPSDNPPGDCAPHAVLTASLLEAMGFAVERHVVPAELVAGCGMRSCVNLVVRHSFGSTDRDTRGPTIALNAHGDVVPPGEGWSTDPYGAAVRDGRMYGRGVAVSKSDIATYAWALAALKARGSTPAAPLSGTVELHVTYDEETGGEIGPAWLLRSGLSNPDYAIGAGFAWGITTAHNGALHLEVEVQGRSAHAASPAGGADAMEAATAIMSTLYGLRRGYDVLKSRIPGISHPTLVIGLVRGGINTNVVPDRVVFRLDRRIIPDESAAGVEHLLTEQIMAAAARWPDIRCEVRRVMLASPFVPMPGQKVLVDAIRRNAYEVLHEDLHPRGVPLYTDARHYSAAGVPTVLYGAGPRTLEEANGHRADENLLLDDLYRATEVVALTLMDLLTPDTHGPHST